MHPIRPKLYVAYLREEKHIKLLGERIKHIRIQKNISQAQLAADCNMEISQISRIERGIINTSISHIFVISKYLGIHPKELFDFEVM